MMSVNRKLEEAKQSNEMSKQTSNNNFYSSSLLKSCNRFVFPFHFISLVIFHGVDVRVIFRMKCIQKYQFDC